MEVASVLKVQMPNMDTSDIRLEMHDFLFYLSLIFTTQVSQLSNSTKCTQN